MVPPGSAAVGEWAAIGDELVPQEGMPPPVRALRMDAGELSTAIHYRQNGAFSACSSNHRRHGCDAVNALLAKVTEALKLR